VEGAATGRELPAPAAGPLGLLPADRQDAQAGEQQVGRVLLVRPQAADDLLDVDRRGQQELTVGPDDTPIGVSTGFYDLC
jgi:hypothetical protein